MFNHSSLLTWPRNAVDVPWFWMRAARYGISLRLAQPGLELLRLSLLVGGALLSALAVAISAKASLALPPLETVGVASLTLAAMGFGLMRYFGNLARIMDVAAWSEEGATRLRRDMDLGMKNRHAYEQLIELYEPIIEVANQELGLPEGRCLEIVPGGKGRYGAVAIPAGDETLEELLRWGEAAHLDGGRFRRLADSRQRLMRKWRSLNSDEKKLEDERGNNYCLTELDVESGRIQLKVGVATYGEIVRSCDALINEFALFGFLTGSFGSSWRPSVRCGRALRMSPGAMLCCLPWRKRIHVEARALPRHIWMHRKWPRNQPPPAARLFLKPQERAAGLGIAMVTVGKDGAGAAQVHLGMRSGLVGTYPSTNHVIPAGMCNTNGTDVGPRVGETRIPSHYLVTAMKCEFIEEWFDEKELEENKRLDWKTLVERSWKERAGHGWEEPVLTGVAFDLLNLRPEVCAATFATARKSRLNWEFDSVGFSGCLKTAREIEPIEIVQSGAAALWLLEQSPAGPRAGAART